MGTYICILCIAFVFMAYHVVTEGHKCYIILTHDTWGYGTKD